MPKIKIAATLVIGLSACASTPPETLDFVTPSGRPEALFLTGEVSEAAGQIANGCMSAGWNVVSSNGYQVVCEGQMTMTQSMLTQLVIGNSYSTTPRLFAQFSLADLGDTVRAQATGWVETQMAFGQMQRMPVDQTVAQRNELQQVLLSFGGVPVPGTVDARNNAKIGFLAAELSSEGQVGGAGAVFVSGVFPGGPASAAGLKVCDRIDAVNGSNVSSFADYAAVASRSTDGMPLRLSIVRAGEPLQLDIRPVTSGLVIDAPLYVNNAKVTSEGCEALSSRRPLAEQ